MDYDTTEIAVVYDRARHHGPENLQLWMSEDEFRAGLAALRAHTANTGDTPVCEPIDVLVFR